MPLHCIGEFWRAVTWDRQPNRVDGDTARRYLTEWIADHRLLLPGDRYWDTLAGMIETRNPSNLGIFDYQITAVCLGRQLETIWTFDAGFPAMFGVIPVDPLSL